MHNISPLLGTTLGHLLGHLDTSSYTACAVSCLPQAGAPHLKAALGETAPRPVMAVSPTAVEVADLRVAARISSGVSSFLQGAFWVQRRLQQ